MTTAYTPAARNLQAFNCPHCGAFAHQLWSQAGTVYQRPYPNGSGFAPIERLSVSTCSHCEQYDIWVGDSLVYPADSPAPLASEDMPTDILPDYNEARDVLTSSPRSSAALLRLVIQKLCIQQGKPGKDLNADIGELVKDGLRPEIQKAFDAVRVIGNESVHPGTIDLNDDTAMALTLFALVNIIVDDLITRKKTVNEMYAHLPQSKRDAIDRRDGTGQTNP